MFIKHTAVPKSELSPQLGSPGGSALPAGLAKPALGAIPGSQLTNKGVRGCQHFTFTGKTAAASSATSELSLLLSLFSLTLPSGFVLHPAHPRALRPRITVPQTLLVLQKQNTAKSSKPNSLKAPV